MPTSYLASKPPPDPAFPNWFTWMKADFSKISTESSQVAALVRINRSLDLVILYKPIPVIATNGTLSAIIGNLNDKKSEPAFIKINGMSIGSAYTFQNYDKIPAEIRPEIPILIDLLTNMVWASAPKDIAICSYPVLAPVPFGAKIIEGHTLNEEFVENMATISPTHKAWAKPISDTIEQQETDDNNETIYQKLISSRDTQTSAIGAATKCIWTTFFVQNPPFLDVSRAVSNEQELKSLHSFFVRNPTPVARVKSNDSDEDDESLQVPVRGASTQRQLFQPVPQ